MYIRQFCNGIQLDYVLPAGPRDYWKDLASAHKTIPEHQNWMYDADPFAAQQRVEQRQAKNPQKRETNSSQDSDSRKYTPSGEFSQLPEVRMASDLRDLVEKAVKMVNNSLNCNSPHDNSSL